MFVYSTLVPFGLLSSYLLGSLYILFIGNFSYFPIWFSTSESELKVLIALVHGHCILATDFRMYNRYMHTYTRSSCIL